MDDLQNLYDELLGRYFFLPIGIRPGEILEKEILSILSQLNRVASKYDETRQLGWYIKEAVDDFDNIPAPRREIVLEAIRLGRLDRQGLVQRVATSLGHKISLVRKTIREATEHKRDGLNIRLIAESTKSP